MGSDSKQVVARRRKSRRGFGSVYRVGKTWYVRIRRHGEEVNEAVGPDKALAEARLAAIVTATWKEQTFGVREVARVTWTEFWPTLASWLRANHAPTTYTVELGREKVVREFLGAKVLCDVTRGDIAALLSSLRNEARGRCKAGMGKAAANRYRAFLSVAFKRAVEAGFARANPTEGIVAFREQQRPVPYLSPDDIDRILARAPVALRAFLTLSADAGCRRSELLALAWSDVELREAAIVVRRSKNSSARRIPLTPRALAVLVALRAEKAPAPLTGSAIVFPGVCPTTVSKGWAAAAKAAGFPGLRLHDARHGFGSGLARAGVAPGVIGTLLGDTTPSVVFRYSRHAPRDANVEAIALLAKARGQAPDEQPKTARSAAS